MPTDSVVEKRIRELHDARFREFEAEVVRQKSLSDRAAKLEATREKRRDAFLKSTGTKLDVLDRERETDKALQERELKAFLSDFKPAVAGRASLAAEDAKSVEIRLGVAKEAKSQIVPVTAATLYAPDRAAIKGVAGLTGDGAINSGWVFPTEPGRLRLKDTAHNPVWCFQASAGQAPPEFAFHFGFIPAKTTNYEMTAVLVFHGFYVLRSDDSWYNCRWAEVKLKVQMNVNQYVDHGWKSFPALIDRHESNAEEVVAYDRTEFLDYTTVLKAGDPVVVTVKGVVDAEARGGGAYAELNFEAGMANYIEPLLLSVIQV